MKYYKQLLTIPFLMLLSFTSCTDENAGNDEDFFENCSTDLCGEWNWIQSSGTIAGITITPESEGISKSLKINDTTYKEFTDDQLVFETEYEIKDDLIEFDSGRQMRLGFEQSEIWMHDLMFDGLSHRYEKK